MFSKFVIVVKYPVGLLYWQTASSTADISLTLVFEMNIVWVIYLRWGHVPPCLYSAFYPWNIYEEGHLLKFAGIDSTLFVISFFTDSENALFCLLCLWAAAYNFYFRRGYFFFCLLLSSWIDCIFANIVTIVDDKSDCCGCSAIVTLKITTQKQSLSYWLNCNESLILSLLCLNIYSPYIYLLCIIVAR